MDRTQHLLMTGASLLIFAIVNATAHQLCDMRAFQIDPCLYIDPAAFSSGDEYTGIACQCQQTCVSLVPYYALLGKGCCDDSLARVAGDCRIVSDARGSILCCASNETTSCHEGPTSKEMQVSCNTQITSKDPMSPAKAKLSNIFNECKIHVKRGTNTSCCNCASNYRGNPTPLRYCPLPTKYSGDSLGELDQAITICTVAQAPCSNKLMTTAAERPSPASGGALTGSIVASEGSSSNSAEIMIWLALSILALMATMS